MTVWIAALFVVALFLLLAKAFGLVKQSKEVIALSQRSLEIIQSADLSDAKKEKALQKNSLRMFRYFFLLALGGAAALLLPLGVLWLADRAGWIILDQVLDFLLSPLFIGIGTVLFIGLGVLRSRTRKAPADRPAYSALDQSLHRMAFSTYSSQVSLAGLEDRLYATQLERYDIHRPVFITALPRAGTTLLLECCAQLPDFATHTYRDMPFIPVPLFWNRFARLFRAKGQARERAHGDGMMIDFDSPEAFEETLWQLYWPDHYRSDYIIPWQREEHAEFKAFFANHMRKIIHLRRAKGATGVRYLSKNNLNIARIPLLDHLFPDAVIVVPFRDPLQHAASLLKQHANFSAMHKKERFAAEYMRAIGHYDFGENLRPIDFDGWVEPENDPSQLGFWLQYWLASYRHLLQFHHRVHFVHYEALCENPQTELDLLARVLATRDPLALLACSRRMHAPAPREVNTSALSPALLEKAGEVFEALKRVCVSVKIGLGDCGAKREK